jgi:hypothetical protein
MGHREHVTAALTNVSQRMGRAGERLRVLLFLAVCARAFGGVVINELNYEPEDITEPGEFIEIHNPGPANVDLSGWRFSDGISYVFPAGAILMVGDYLVLAESPEFLLSRYGVAALGPYSGKLSNQGERVDLETGDGILADRVEFKIAFPWPLASAGDGSSMQLINPSLDNDLGGSWRAGPPTPGARNAVFADNAPPQIRQVDHLPVQPRAGERVVVSAKVTDPDGVERVSVRYQIVRPGNYVPAYYPLAYDELLADATQDREPNPDFEAPGNWTTVTMTDDGTGADAAAGDHIYTATLPFWPNRTLVRYRIAAVDAAEPSAAVEAPFADDASLNFAYFVYDGVPPYEPTARTVHPDGLGHVYSAEIMTSLPVYFLITRDADMAQCVAFDPSFQIPKTNTRAREAFNWEGAFACDGIVYDHIHYRLRGYNQRYQLQMKRNMRFRFNRGCHFQAKDQRGREYPTAWRSLNTAKMFGPRNTGNFGVAETINNFLWNLVGVAAPFTHTFHFRVIDGAEEAPSGTLGQYEGDFWGMYLAMEDYDSRFLTAHHLPDGNLYKLKDGELDGEEEQRYQAANAVTNAEDYENIRDDVTGLRPARSEEWLRTFVDYDFWYRYGTVCQAIRHYDFGVYPERSNPDSTAALKNAAWFFLPEEGNPLGKLCVMPYDSEQSWGPNGAHQGWDLPLYSMVDPRDDHDFSGGPDRKPELMKDFRNFIREFRDLIWNEETLVPMIHRFGEVVARFADADRDRWKDHPLTGGQQSDFGRLEDLIEDMQRFAFVGGDWPIFNEDSVVGPGGRAAFLDAIAGLDGDDGAIPDTPAVSAVDPRGFDIRSLVFETTPFRDPQGDDTFGALVWRVGEVTDPEAPAYDPDADPLYEWSAVWTSGVLREFRNRSAVPPGFVREGHSYRIRVRMMDDTGRWGHWSAPVRFIPTMESTHSPGDIIITEFMANAAGDDDGREWIELFNTTDGDVDLTGWSIGDNEDDDRTIEGSGPVVVPAKGYLVLGQSADTQVNGGVPVGYAFGDAVTLGNESDEIILRQGRVVIHSVGYGDYTAAPHRVMTSLGGSPPEGAAWGMAGDYCDGPVDVWAVQTAVFNSKGDAGTPGKDNENVAVCGGADTPFVRGDANADGSHNIADVIFVLGYLFGAGDAPACMKSADANDSGTIDIADAIRLLGVLFSDGPDLDPPFGACGPDSIADSLGCTSFPPCK